MRLQRTFQGDRTTELMKHILNNKLYKQTKMWLSERVVKAIYRNEQSIQNTLPNNNYNLRNTYTHKVRITLQK